MIGAIAGDIIGSPYEGHEIKTVDFPLFCNASTFTDDTVLTVAVADAILNGRDYGITIKEYGRKYPYAGYGGMFLNWLASSTLKPYNSFGNGSAMRVSPVGFAFDTIEEVLEEARKSAAVTHNHPEGIKGAQATAAAIFLARQGESKRAIKRYTETKFGYNLSRTVDEIRSTYGFDETCQGTVPEAITAFLESNDYEDAIRKAISLGGDSDTLACITGGIAQAHYKTISPDIIYNVKVRLPPDMLWILSSFTERYKISF